MKPSVSGEKHNIDNLIALIASDLSVVNNLILSTKNIKLYLRLLVSAPRNVFCVKFPMSDALINVLSDHDAGLEITFVFGEKVEDETVSDTVFQ